MTTMHEITTVQEIEHIDVDTLRGVCGGEGWFADFVGAVGTGVLAEMIWHAAKEDVRDRFPRVAHAASSLSLRNVASYAKRLVVRKPPL